MAETASPTKPKTKGPAPLLVSKYLQSLSQVKEKLANEGRGLVWCGIGRDTFADALAIQLAQSGISSSSVSLKGYIFKEEGTLPGQYPSASAAVRMDILRYNAANAESFSGIADGAERNLRAAAEKYSVKITCFTLGAKGEVGSKDFGPRPGIDARTQLFLVRKGDHFISVTKEASGAADELFANVALDEILPELERRAHTINLISDAEAAAELAASRETRPATQGGTALRGKAPMGVVVLGGGAPVPTLVRLSARRNPEERIWLLNQALMAEAGSVVVVPETGPAGSDLFVALVPALEVAGAGLRSPKVAGQGGNVMESGPATRMLRSEVIMYGQAHKSKLLNLQTPQMELASVALKYRVTVHLFTLSNLQVTKEVFAPNEGVVSRADVYIARDDTKYWATEAFKGTESDFEEMRVAAEEAISLAQLDAPSEEEEFDDGEMSEAEAAGPPEDLEGGDEKQVVFDRKTGSWKMVSQDQVAAEQQAMLSGSEQEAPAKSSGSFLPRFSKFKSAASAPSRPPGGPTIGDAMLAAQVGGKAGGRADLGMTMGQRLASTAAGRDGAFPASEGMVKLENSLEDQGLMLDRSGGGGNVYLTLAELIHKAGLEVQGLMFTMWGEEQEGALVGALSQKARTDAKKYINNNIDDEVFDRPGEFLGDHDLLALARIYKVRIKVMMVIYDTEVQTKEFGPEEGVEAKATLYMCLDRKRFWPVVQIADPEAEARKKEMAIEKENAPPPPKKRLTALEKIQQKYAPEAAALEGGAGGGKASGFPGGAVTVKASQKQSATVILLHGMAGSGADWAPLAEALHLPWAKFIFPTAGQVAVAAGTDVRSWLAVSRASVKVHSNALNAVPSVMARMHSKINDDLPSVEASINLVLELVKKEIASGVPAERIILAGFSHGAAIALEAALRSEEKLGGVVALSPWFLAGIPRESPKWREQGDIPALFCHGLRDKIVQPAFIKYIAEGEDMALAGVAADVQLFAGLAHAVSAQELTAVRNFLLKSIPGGAATDPNAQLPPIRKAGVPKMSMAKLWGDGSSVSQQRERLLDETQTGLAEQRLALEEEAVANNLQVFAETWKDPAEDLWKSLG